MGNPMPEGDYKKRLDIVCSLVSPVKNELSKNEKAGDATKATTYGDKEVANIQEHLVQEFMQVSVQDFDFQIEPDGTIVRNVEGRKVEISEESMEQINEKIQKEQNKQKVSSKRTSKIQDEEAGR